MSPMYFGRAKQFTIAYKQYVFPHILYSFSAMKCAFKELNAQ